MGLDIGFNFYRKCKIEDNKLFVQPVDTKELNLSNDLYNIESHGVFVCGRCDATYAFSNWVERRSSECGEKEYPDVILNGDEFNGLILNDITVDYDKHQYSRGKLFFQSIDDLERVIDFEGAEKDWKDMIKNIEDNIQYIEQEINKLREFQCKAETKAAFDGFQEQIDELQGNLSDEKEWLAQAFDDDYEYTHAKMIHDDIQEVKRVLKEYPDVLVTAWTSY